MEMEIWKVEAEGDTLYIHANNQHDASQQLKHAMGPIPASLLTWTKIDALPEGEEYL